VDNINVRKLHKEIEQAGIEICGCDSGGKVLDKDNNEIQDRADVKKVIKKHDPTPIPVETEEERIVKIVKDKFDVVEKVVK